MRRYLQALALIFISAILVQCQKEVSFVGGPDPVIITPAPVTAELQGNVFDENNQPVAGAIARVGNKTATTNALGYFRISDASLDKKSALVTVELPGYFKAFRSFAATTGANHVEIKLTPKSLAGTVDAVAGGEVSLSNGAKVALQPNGVVLDASGAAYTGTVNIYAAYIDPTLNDIDRTVPGSFMASDINNNRVVLGSYGMMAVELESPSGQKLQVKSGTPAKLTMPIPSSLQGSAPATMPLWYVDEQTGIWKEEGVSTKSGNVYVGDVAHFTYWNCDLPFSSNQISFTLHTPSGDPLVHAYVRIVRASNPNVGMVHGITDSLGQANPFVPLNEQLQLTVYGPCGEVIFTQNIGPFTQPTDLGVITVNNSSNAIVTVTGTLLDCNGAVVTDGYAIIQTYGILRYAAVDANGVYSITFVKCNTGSADVSIIGIDANNNQQGSLQVLPLTVPVTNAGNYNACGTSSNEFVNYTLDGVDYSITNSVQDSLQAWTSQQGTTPFSTYISGFSISSNDGISFMFSSPSAVAGIYPLTELWVNNAAAQSPGSLSVNITNFPTTIGQFYEGSLSGSYVDSQGVTHTLSCTFRIRRLF